MLSLSDIVNNKKKRDEKKEEVFQVILKECCAKIRKSDEMKNLYCIYTVPEFIIGFPIFNLNECITYIMKEISKRGFQTQYIFPNIIVIAWFNIVEKENEQKKNNQHKTLAITGPNPTPKRRGRPPASGNKKAVLTITHQKAQM